MYSSLTFQVSGTENCTAAIPRLAVRASLRFTLLPLLEMKNELISFLPASTDGRVPACLFLTAALALPVVSSLLGLGDL
jgi:hypothetical protein